MSSSESSSPAAPSVLAIDVVLALPDQVKPLAVQANARLIQTCPAGKGFVFDDSHAPHITLYQTYVRPADVEAVYDAIVDNVVCQFESPMTLTVDDIALGPIFDGVHLPSYAIRQDKSLMMLHSALVKHLAKFRVADAVKLPEVDGFFYRDSEKEVINDASRQWVRDFEIKSSLDNFFPHCTLGAGVKETIEELRREFRSRYATADDESEAKNQDTEVDGHEREAEKSFLTFNVPDIRVYQLGNFCTCRKLLWSVSIDQSEEDVD